MNASLSFDPTIPVVQSDSETDELVYRLSHDLRASVRALQELPGWISEDLDKAALRVPAATERHLKLISSHACRLDLMLTGLLEHSRVGRMQLIAAVQPARVLAEVIDDLGVDDDVSVTVDMDRGNIQMGLTDLQRMFSILILNAVRHHPTHAPRIAITGRPQPSRVWVLEVADNGPGIPEAKREHVMRPMTKLVSRDIDPGAGMGLAILRKIAFTYGGGVEIETPKSGAGTLVRVTLAVN